MTPLVDLLTRARVYDLAQPYYLGMPHYPSHPPFLYSLVKLHGEYVGPAGHSTASDALALGSHIGTHIDALCHFSVRGKLHGGEAAAPPSRTVSPHLPRHLALVQHLAPSGPVLLIGDLGQGHATAPRDQAATRGRRCLARGPGQWPRDPVAVLGGPYC